MTARRAATAGVRPPAEVPLQQLTMLVTADGQWVLPDSEGFRGALGDPGPDYDAVGFAVRNLGFVKFQVLDRLVTEIELHPRHVELPALLALERLVGEVGTNLFRIRYLDDEWHSEISASAEHTVARLRELCAPAFQPSQTERFHVDPQDPRVLRRKGDEQNLATILEQKWRVSFGRFDPSVLSLALDYRLMPHLAIVGVKSDNEEPVFRYMGEVHSNWLERNQLKAVGEKVASVPDGEYGHWAAQFYKSVARTGQPRYDHIAATINAGARPYVTHYERLLLPWKSDSGEVLVTAFSRRLPASAGTSSSSSRNAAKSS
jgi:hypothetical protein